MSDSNPRIEQFRKMAEADPENELGHFSLGKAYLDAGQTAPAIQSFQRIIELNPNIAKVYQMLATALLKENRKPEAIDRLTHGVEIAAARRRPHAEKRDGSNAQGPRRPPFRSPSPPPRSKRPAKARSCAIAAAASDPRCPARRSATPRERKFTRRSAQFLGANGFTWARRSSTNCAFRCPIRRLRKSSISTCGNF